MNTRPGSETTNLKVGDRVRMNRAEPARGSWDRYDGREGYVTAVNRQTFPDGRTYVELGVSFLPNVNRTRRGSEVWFRADELVPA
jgi:hypothetical protein